MLKLEFEGSIDSFDSEVETYTHQKNSIIYRNTVLFVLQIAKNSSEINIQTPLIKNI